MQEQYLATCLSSGFSRPMRAPQRVALATRQDEFKLLQKPWQGILLLALHEVEAPGVDEDEEDGPSLPARAPRGARARQTPPARRGRRTSMGPSLASGSLRSVWLRRSRV